MTPALPRTADELTALLDAVEARARRHALADGMDVQRKAFEAAFALFEPLVRKAFDPAEHPRDHGKFSSKPGSGADGSAPAHPDAGTHASHAAEGLAAKLPPGVWDRVGDRVMTAAARVYGVMLRATPAGLKALAILDGVLTTGDDLKKFGYEPMGSLGSSDTLKNHTGISAQVAATIASHVLGRAYVYAKGKLGGAVTKAVDDGADEAAGLLAEMLSHVADALGLDWEPDPARIAAALRGGGGPVEKAFGPSVRKAWDESKHPRGDNGHFIAKEELEAARTNPAKAAALRKRVTDPEERAKLDAHIKGGKKPAKQTAKGGEYLLNVVKRYGGINSNSRDFFSHYDNIREAVADGMPLQAFSKESHNGLDTLAEELEADGHISVPENKHASEHLLDLLREKAYSLHADLSDQIAAEYEEYARREQEAYDHAERTGADRSEVEGAVRLGEAAGRAEGAAGAGGEGQGDGGRADPELPDGPEGVDDSFDFGFNTSPGGEPAPAPNPHLAALDGRTRATHDAVRAHLAGTAPDKHQQILAALRGHTVPELHAIKRALGLTASGVKADLVNKIALKAQGMTAPTQGYTGRLRTKTGDVQVWQKGKQVGTIPGDNPAAESGPQVGQRMTVDEAHAHVRDHFARGGHTTEEGRAALRDTLESRLSVKELRELKQRLGVSASGGKSALAGKIADRAKESAADRMDRELSPLDQANAAGVRLGAPQPADGFRTDAHAQEAEEAALDKRDRMAGWAADKPGSVAAEGAQRAAQGRLDRTRNAGTQAKPGGGATNLLVAPPAAPEAAPNVAPEAAPTTKHPHEMTASDAIKAGLKHGEWTHHVGRAFVDEKIDDDHPAYKSSTATKIDDYLDAAAVHGREVRTSLGHYGKVTDFAPNLEHAVVQHPDGTTSKHGTQGLSDVFASLRYDAEDGKKLSQSDVNHAADVIARGAVASGQNIWRAVEDAIGIPGVKARELVKAVSAKADAIRGEASKPSEERQRAMDRARQVQAAEDAPAAAQIAPPSVQAATPLSTEVPPRVADHVKRQLETLKDHGENLERGRHLDKIAGGGGRYEREHHEGNKKRVDAALKNLAEFRKMAADNGVDADAVIASLGGIPDHQPSPKGRDYRYADEPDIDEKPTPSRTQPAADPAKDSADSPALTPAELAAVRSYKNAGHSAVNRALRGGGATDPRDAATVAGLDTAVAKHSLPAPTTVHRGYGNAHLLADSGFPADPKPGDTFTDAGFASTSTDPAKVGASWGKGPGAVTAEIRLPAGVGAMPTDRHVENQGAEDELLLERGLNYRIVSRTPKPGGEGYHLVLEASKPAASPTVGETPLSLASMRDAATRDKVVGIDRAASADGVPEHIAALNTHGVGNDALRTLAREHAAGGIDPAAVLADAVKDRTGKTYTSGGRVRNWPAADVSPADVAAAAKRHRAGGKTATTSEPPPAAPPADPHADLKAVWDRSHVRDGTGAKNSELNAAARKVAAMKPAELKRFAKLIGVPSLSTADPHRFVLSHFLGRRGMAIRQSLGTDESKAAADAEQARIGRQFVDEPLLDPKELAGKKS